ncbi:MAG: hypothetical protein RLY61_446, partial [Candidatus Parcubacteria bacterium]
PVVKGNSRNLTVKHRSNFLKNQMLKYRPSFEYQVTKNERLLLEIGGP